MHNEADQVVRCRQVAGFSLGGCAQARSLQVHLPLDRWWLAHILYCKRLENARPYGSPKRRPLQQLASARRRHGCLNLAQPRFVEQLAELPMKLSACGLSWSKLRQYLVRVKRRATPTPVLYDTVTGTPRVTTGLPGSQPGCSGQRAAPSPRCDDFVVHDSTTRDSMVCPNLSW